MLSFIDNMNKKYRIKIDENNYGKRLDITIIERIPSLTRSHLKNSISQLLVNNKEKKLSYNTKINDILTFEIEEKIDETTIIPEDIALDIVFEDNNYIIINKKYGMVVHPAKGNFSGTVVNALLGLNKKLSDIDKYRPGIVHRLDKETSGLLIIAKNNKAHNYLQTLFKNREITKKYHAIVTRFFKYTELHIENQIGRDTKNRKKMAVVNSITKGKSSITEVKLINRTKDYSYLDIDLKTGRTHQIRVHLSHIGYPVLGDKIYSRSDNRNPNIPLCLVAYNLQFFDIFSNQFININIDNPLFMNEFIEGNIKT